MKFKKAVLGLSVMIAGCAPTVSGQGPEAFNLAGSEWAVAPGDNQPFVQFSAEGKASGNGGCNRFSGSFEQAGQVLSFGPIVSTKRACLELNVETAFFNALSQTRSFEGDHLKMTLKSEGGDEILTLVCRDWD